MERVARLSFHVKPSKFPVNTTAMVLLFQTILLKSIDNGHDGPVGEASQCAIRL